MEWLENGRAGILQAALRALRGNVVHNRSGLPPFRLPHAAEQLIAGLAEFAGAGDSAAARGLGERLAEQGLGLRSLLAALRAITREAALVLPAVIPRPEAPAPSPRPEASAAGPLHEPSVLIPLQGPTALLEDFSDLVIEGAARFEVHDVVRQRDEMQAAAERAAAAREGELRQVIQSLSTPIMPIHERVLVVPLIGAIDDDRAAEITENLLHEVVLRKARIILVDVTGVSGIDATVAGGLARTARAVQLIGAQVVLVGIRPDLATVLVDAGLDLAGLRTLADLRGGIEWALGQMGLVVARRSGARGAHGD